LIFNVYFVAKAESGADAEHHHDESQKDIFEVYEGRERDEIVRQVLRMCACLTSVVTA